MKSTTRAFVFVGCFLILISGTAQASSWHRLAYSKKMGAEVFVNQAGGSWCKDAVSVKVNLESKSPLLTSGLQGFLKKVGTVLSKDCTSASSARFDVFKNGGIDHVASYTGLANNGWAMAPIESKGKSLDDMPAASPKKAAASSLQKQEIKPVQANYLNLIQGVMPDAANVLAKPDAINDYLKIKHCKEYSRAKSNEIKLAKLGKGYVQEATAFLDKQPPEFITLTIRSEVGKYNIQNETFAFQPLMKDSAFSFDRPGSWDCRRNNTFPDKIVLNISGGEFIQEISMTPDKAEDLLKKLRYREVLIVATLKVFRWDQFAGGSDNAVAHTILHSAKVLNRRTQKAFYEFPHSWLGAKIEKKQAELMEAERIRQQQLEEEKVQREKEAAALADRIDRGVEPLAVDGDVAYAHFEHLSSHGSDSYIVNGVDMRRPLLIVADGRVDSKSNTIVQGRSGTDITYRLKAKSNGETINVVIQNSKDYAKQDIPDEILKDLPLKTQALWYMDGVVRYTAKPVGYMDDPWKGGKGLVVHVSSAEYGMRPNNAYEKQRWRTWTVAAKTPEQKFAQKQDTRTARELDVAGMHGGMELGDVQDILEDELRIEAAFNENTKILKSSEELFVSDFFTQGSFTPGLRHFEGRFVQTGKSLMGLGSPVYSLKQAILGQTASIEEKEAIIDGLISKFGDPDLTVTRGNQIAFTWGKRITDDRSNMPVGKDLRLPVSSVEAQVYYSDKGVFTILILTDDLYLKKTKVTTKTVY